MRPGWARTSGVAAAMLIVAAGLAVTGCETKAADLSPSPGGASTTDSSGSAAPASPAERAAGSGAIAPLTGLPAASAEAAGLPAVAVPVAGTDPSGLSSADVVFEEVSQPVRYLAVFQSHQNQSVGPVAGTRPADGQELSVLHPLYGYYGGTPGFVKVLDRTSVIDVGYARFPSIYHSGDAGMTVSTSQLGQARQGTAEPHLFTYRGAGIESPASFATTGAWSAASVHITAPGLGTQVWTFDPRTARWADTAGGPSVQVANLVVQSVPYKTVNLSTRYGLTVSSARTIGAGQAIVLSSPSIRPGASRTGVAVKAQWSKPGLHDVTDFLDANGRPLGFQPGPTWVVLAPPGTKTTTTTAAAS
jgi:hypothetical protein